MTTAGFLFFARHAIAAVSSDRIRSQALAFHRWYLDHADDQTIPTDQAAIGAYRTAAYRTQLVADYRAKRFVDAGDPFLAVQDYNEADWKAHVSAAEPTGSGQGRTDLCIHLRHAGSAWKISKVDRADDPAGPDGMPERRERGRSATPGPGAARVDIPPTFGPAASVP